MSITGSLVGYENNNDMANCSAGGGSIMSKKNRSLLNMSSASTKQCVSLNSSISNSVITTASGASGSRSAKGHLQQQRDKLQQHRLKRRRKLHLNTLWSIWYGILGTVLQSYLILHGAQRYLGCSLLTWNHGEPATELSIQILMCVLVVALLPLFFCCAVFRVGNMANDGFKLASGGSGKCSAEPEDGLEVEAQGGTLRALWTHGGPTSAFVHIVAALCLLLPRLLLEARLIENGNLQREQIWRTELDFLVVHKDRLVVLSFMTSSPYQNDSNGLLSGNGIADSSSGQPASHRPIRYDFPNPLGGSDTAPADDRIGLNSFDDAGEESVLDDMLYQRTHLIERFNEDTDGADMFEKLEAASPVSTVATVSSTAAAGVTSTSPITSTAQTTTTTRKAERAKTGRKSAGGKKNGRNRNRDESELEESAELALPTGRANKKTGHSQREDIDERLELQSNSKIDFGRIDEFDDATPVFEVNRKSGGVELATGKPVRVTDQVTKRKMAAARDSDIHVVKPEKSPDAIAASNIVTPMSTDSKIIEIKPSSKSSRKIKRDTTASVDHELDYFHTTEINDEQLPSLDIEPAALIGAVPAANVSVTPVRLTGLSGLLQRLLGVERELDTAAWSAPPSLEFLNVALAILVWSARYPSVFWGTSKAFALIFSVQLIANGLDILLGFAGISVLYKLQVCGPALPAGAPGLLLNAGVTAALYVLSTLLIIASALILYLYGHGRLSARIRDRRIISSKTGDTWRYFAHCASLCFVLALAVVKASLMHDLSAAYRGSLDGAVLLAALTSVTHILLWCVLWLCLTLKRRWAFKLPPLQQSMGSGGGGGSVGGGGMSTVQQPLLVSPRTGRLTQGLLQGSLHHGHPQQGASVHHNGGAHAEDIYWPKQPSSPKLKVTFNEIPSTSSDHEHLMGEHDGKRNPGRRTSLRMSSPAGEADDGDYATLRGPTGALLHLDETDYEGHHHHHHHHHNHQHEHDLMADDTSEEGKLLACVRDDSVTYASTRDLEPPNTTTTTITSSSASSATSPPPPPQLMHDNDDDIHGDNCDDDLPPPPDNFLIDPIHDGLISPMAPVTVTVHANEANHPPGQTPRCLRRADSGVPTDALLTPRSDTTSTESSTSPPERALSETSSGVHSSEEREEIYIRSRPAKAIVKPPQPAIAEEPFGRSTNMRMSSFNNLAGVIGSCNQSSATLPLNRASVEHQRLEYASANHCNTMPLQSQHRSQSFQPGAAISASMCASTASAASGSPYAMHRNSLGNSQQQQQQPQHPYQPQSHQQHSTLPSAIRFAANTAGSQSTGGGIPQPSAATANFLRRVPHVKNAESPYGILGLGAGHHTFSKLLHDPLMCHSIPEDRDSANYSMISESDREMFAGGAGH